MILTVIALLPVFVILLFVYLRDKDREPMKTLLTAFGLGVLTVIPSALIESFLELFVPNDSFPLLSNFFCVGLTEEFFKLLVLLFYVFRHKDFNDTFDGIVYSVAVSLGFAAAENLLYTFENGVETGILRAVTSVPGHASFAVFMGYFIPKAKTNHFYLRFSKRNKYILLALIVPMLIHGLYDYLITLQAFEAFFTLILFVDIFEIIIIIRSIKNDKSVMVDIEKIENKKQEF